MAEAKNLGASEERDALADATSLFMSGLKGLIAATERYIQEEQGETRRVIQRLSEDFAYIHWQDIRSPYKFLRQMEGSPPIRLGTQGFRRELVDDHNPARHYMAFVAMGYWLPYWLAMAVLYLWEIAGFIRYGFTWSQADLQSGLVGVRHGNAVRRVGIEILPELMTTDLAADVSEPEELAVSQN
jgi:hypothetical protein